MTVKLSMRNLFTDCAGGIACAACAASADCEV